MLAKELQAGDEYRDADGNVLITILTDAVSEGVNPVNGKLQVYVGVRHADGGHAPRYFDADDEVPYTRPK
jgi:hypothetical protein